MQLECFFFHFGQASCKKIVDLGLRQSYQEDLEFSIKLRQLTVLAFVPVDQIRAAFEELKDTLPLESDRLVWYFEQTYVCHCTRADIADGAF